MDELISSAVSILDRLSASLMRLEASKHTSEIFTLFHHLLVLIELCTIPQIESRCTAIANRGACGKSIRNKEHRK
ncbi:hypothetical protein ACHAWO_008427 [Cyclotella atomus]|uniref:Uncharacterized protein n=1 Tax=Cyclotella atomus TaxID=382360 RepID=A0ABD3NNU9_9STRA